jgi:hypothetical protein
MKMHQLLGACAAALLIGCGIARADSPAPQFYCGQTKVKVVNVPVPNGSAIVEVVFGFWTSPSKHPTDWSLDGSTWSAVGGVPKVVKPGPQAIQFLSRMDTDLPPAGLPLDLKANTITKITVTYHKCTGEPERGPGPGHTPAARGKAHAGGNLGLLDTGHETSPFGNVSGNYGGNGQIQVNMTGSLPYTTTWMVASTGPFNTGDIRTVSAGLPYRIQYTCKVSGHVPPPPHTVTPAANHRVVVPIYYTHP